MSYDGWIEVAVPDRDEPLVCANFGNYTSNVSRMWGWALSLVCETPMRLADTEGWSCEKAAPILAKAVAVMEAERPRMEAWNPENGWGDFNGALEYLRNAAELSHQFAPPPTARLRWWV